MADGAGARAGLWTRADVAIAAGLVLLGLIARWPFRTRMLWAWDSGLFAQALRDYNVVAHHPQPPGYVYYVGLGKLIAALTGWEANAAYVAISMVAASLTAGALYLLGALIFDRLTGLLAGAWRWPRSRSGSSRRSPTPIPSWRSARPCWRCWPGCCCTGGSRGPGRRRWRSDRSPASGRICSSSSARSSRPASSRGWGAGLAGRAAWGQLGLAALAGIAGVAAWWAATDLASEGWGSLWRSLTAQGANVERGTSAFATGRAGLRANAALLVNFGNYALHLAISPRSPTSCSGRPSRGARAGARPS